MSAREPLLTKNGSLLPLIVFIPRRGGLSFVQLQGNLQSSMQRVKFHSRAPELLGPHINNYLKLK